MRVVECWRKYSSGGEPVQGATWTVVIETVRGETGPENTSKHEERGVVLLIATEVAFYVQCKKNK